MFNNSSTTFGSGAGAVVPTPATTVPNTVFPGNIVTTNGTFIIIGPPPPFPAPPRSIDLSPLKLIFAVIAIVAIPSLAYALFFAYPCSSDRRRSSSPRRSTTISSFSDDVQPHIIDEIPPPIEKVPTNTHSKDIGDEKCTICLSLIADGQEIRQLNECKHEFHASCLEKWFKDKPNPNCPICRIDVPVKEQTEANRNGTVNINGNVNRSVRNPRVTARYRDDDWRQGLPDASSLV